MHKRTISLLLCFAALVVAMGPQVAQAIPSGNFIEFETWREDTDGNGTADLFGAEIFGEIPDATAIEILFGGGGSETFDFGGGEFWLESDEHATLAALNAEIGGTHTLRITHSGGVTDYEFTMGTITDGMFPALPVLAPVPASIPQNYNFQWAWSGSADEMDAEAEIDGSFYDEEESFGGSFVVGVTTDWTPDFAPHTGLGEFYVGYANMGDVAADNGLVVSDWLLAAGPDIFAGPNDEVLDFADSGDIAFFNVVPEPATMTILALGACLPLFRRKRR